MGPISWGQHGILLFTDIQLGLNINFTGTGLSKVFMNLIILSYFRIYHSGAILSPKEHQNLVVMPSL